jgi:hypothetical protein
VSSKQPSIIRIDLAIGRDKQLSKPSKRNTWGAGSSKRKETAAALTVQYRLCGFSRPNGSINKTLYIVRIIRKLRNNACRAQRPY